MLRPIIKFLTGLCLALTALSAHAVLTIEITKGSETELDNEIMSAVSQTRGHRLILANGCSIPDDTPEMWLHTARQLVNNLR